MSHNWGGHCKHFCGSQHKDCNIPFRSARKIDFGPNLALLVILSIGFIYLPCTSPLQDTQSVQMGSLGTKPKRLFSEIA